MESFTLREEVSSAQICLSPAGGALPLLSALPSPTRSVYWMNCDPALLFELALKARSEMLHFALRF
jgi:hypothetical protein